MSLPLKYSKSLSLCESVFPVVHGVPPILSPQLLTASKEVLRYHSGDPVGGKSSSMAAAGFRAGI